jgi:hypothetical protein
MPSSGLHAAERASLSETQLQTDYMAQIEFHCANIFTSSIKAETDEKVSGQRRCFDPFHRPRRDEKSAETFVCSKAFKGS